MSLEYDVSGLNTQQAKEFLLGHITALKETERQYQSNLEEFKLWQQRSELAAKKQREDLKLAAQARSEEIKASLEKLLAEMQELKKGIDVIKSQLPAIAAESELTIDAEALALELEAVAGKPDLTAQAIKDLDTEQQLENLKAKINKSPGDSGDSSE
jgi:chromosome segregation ATPase